MPYKRSYRGRYKKRSYRKSYNYKAKGYGGYLGTASKALAVAYGIKRLLNVEFKFHDVQATSLQIQNTPVIVQITNIPQGDTSETRDGAQVKLTRLSIKYKFVGGNAADAMVRIMLIHDKQTNQAIYSASDLLQDVTANDNIVSATNLDNKYRFHVLYNKVVRLSNATNNTVYQEIMKDVDIRLRFDASTPSIADLTSSSLSLLFVSTLTTTAPLLTLFSRVRYVDN